MDTSCKRVQDPSHDFFLLPLPYGRNQSITEVIQMNRSRSISSRRVLAFITVLFGAMLTTLPLYGQQDVDPTWYDPYPAPHAVLKPAVVQSSQPVALHQHQPAVVQSSQPVALHQHQPAVVQSSQLVALRQHQSAVTSVSSSAQGAEKLPEKRPTTQARIADVAVPRERN
jgi:hypothetical protein